MNAPEVTVPKVVRVEVHAARPEAADLRKIHHYSDDRAVDLPQVTWVYKIYLDELPEPAGAGLELLVGDHSVRKYSAFPGGLFFTVNDPDLIEKMAGGDVRFRVHGTDEVVEGGARMPPAELAPHGHGLAVDSAADAELPAQLDLLRS